jgi:hypothetical protein
VGAEGLEVLAVEDHIAHDAIDRRPQRAGGALRLAFKVNTEKKRVATIAHNAAMIEPSLGACRPLAEGVRRQIWYKDTIENPTRPDWPFLKDLVCGLWIGDSCKEWERHVKIWWHWPSLTWRLP